MTAKVQTPLVERTALCVGFGSTGADGSRINFTVPVTTGLRFGRFTLTLKITGLFVFVAVIESTLICVGSFVGIKSITSGIQLPLVKFEKMFGEPRNTLRSNLVPGTPYFGAIPHDVYCHIVHVVAQPDVVHECT